MPDRVFPIDPVQLAAVSDGSWADVAEQIRPAG
jgi:hypothetical protein